MKYFAVFVKEVVVGRINRRDFRFGAATTCVWADTPAELVGALDESGVEDGEFMLLVGDSDVYGRSSREEVLEVSSKESEKAAVYVDARGDLAILTADSLRGLCADLDDKEVDGRVVLIDGDWSVVDKE